MNRHSLSIADEPSVRRSLVLLATKKGLRAAVSSRSKGRRRSSLRKLRDLQRSSPNAPEYGHPLRGKMLKEWHERIAAICAKAKVKHSTMYVETSFGCYVIKVRK